MADNHAAAPLYLALDQGGSGCRALVFNKRGERVAEARRTLRTMIDGARIELDGNELVSGLRSAAEEALAQLGESQTRVEAAALATQRSNIICWRRSSGEPLSPVLSWQDRRAADRLAGLDATLVKTHTGLFPNAHYGASKIAWCLEHLPAVRQAQCDGDLLVGPMASFIASRLTTSPALADPVNASRTLLWHLEHHDWDTTLCHHFAIDPHLLPPAVDSDHGFGRLRLEGLELPLEIVTGDLAAAAFANGPPSSDQAII
ncbi:MAG: FGGY family carbohydrate kinase, partial [Chromatiales bacterium]|nr:FGGY family carbohydrate kinase [Chromatiales bacterium]